MEPKEREEAARELIRRANSALVERLLLNAEDIAKLESERKKVLAAIKAFKRNTTPILRKMQNDLDAQAPDVGQYDWPEPQEGDEDADPMFDSTRGYLDQIDRYKLFNVE